MAPPLLARRDSDGRPAKMRFGPWMMKAFRLLAAARRLRGTAFDIFSYTAERRAERALLARYEADLNLAASALAPDSIEAATALASVPSLIRGYGHVRAAAVAKAEAERQRLVERLQAFSTPSRLEAAE